MDVQHPNNSGPKSMFSSSKSYPPSTIHYVVSLVVLSVASFCPFHLLWPLSKNERNRRGEVGIYEFFSQLFQEDETRLGEVVD